MLLCGLDSVENLDVAMRRRIHLHIQLTQFSPEQLCTVAAHVLKSKIQEVDWPHEDQVLIDRILKNMMGLTAKEPLQSIDKMMEFIRGRLTTAKCKATENNSVWQGFLDILFSYHSEHYVDPQEQSRKRVRTSTDE